MTLTKKHFISLAKVSASIQEVCDNKSKEENVLTAITQHALYEIKSFCINHGKNFDSSRFDNYIKEELERREIQKEKRRIRKHENALERLHNHPQFGMPKPKKKFSDNKYAMFKFGLK